MLDGMVDGYPYGAIVRKRVLKCWPCLRKPLFEAVDRERIRINMDYLFGYPYGLANTCKVLDC